VLVKLHVNCLRRIGSTGSRKQLSVNMGSIPEIVSQAYTIVDYLISVHVHGEYYVMNFLIMQ
jgi:hypothetical protein